MKNNMILRTIYFALKKTVIKVILGKCTNNKSVFIIILAILYCFLLLLDFNANFNVNVDRRFLFLYILRKIVALLIKNLKPSLNVQEK